MYTVESHYNMVVGVLSGDHVIDEACYCEVTAESRSQYSSHSVLRFWCNIVGRVLGARLCTATSTFCWILITIQITSVIKSTRINLGRGAFGKKPEPKTDTKKTIKPT